jgi:tRNA-splicing ligase RtcB
MRELPEKPKEIRQISETVWEVPTSHKKGMLVPARIYATKKLLQDMDAGVFNQVTNVACLPGIQKYAYCMPDGHWGYGFPIGGVAAFDSETGVISPGGIGFDINCLVRDSKIMTEHGYKRSIQDFESDFIDVDNLNSNFILKTRNCIQSVLSFDMSQKLFSSKEIAFFMKKKHFGSIFQIQTRLGYTIQVTEDHPILTKKGMIKAENVRKGHEIAIHPFEGVNFEELKDGLLIKSETIFTKQEKDELKKRDLLYLKLNNPKIPIIAKLFGYLLGDGSIYLSGKKGFVCAYGSEEDLKEIQDDFKKLGFSAKIYSRKRNHKIPTKYGDIKFEADNFELHLPSNSLAKLYFALGYPQGTKTAVSYLIPNWILESPLWIKRLFLSGFFGAELSSPRTHTKTGFDCPTVSINKNTVLLDNVREFCIQIMNLLEEFGINTHKLLERKDYKNRFGPTHRVKLQISSEEKNLLKLWSKIGFSYNKKRETLSHIAIVYIKEKKLLTKIRKNTAIKVKEFRKKGLKVKEVKKLLESPFTNKRFIHRHYYENAGQRITLSFISFNDFVKNKLKEIKKYGTLFDQIESISKKTYDDYVYDFNIPKTHNFIANNIVVSNCGMRLVTTNLTFKDVQPKLRELVDTMFKTVPAGVGSRGFVDASKEQFKEIITDGSKWCVENGYGWQEDLERTEGYGKIDWADPEKVSQKALDRGIKQLGTLGSGNHYLEIQVARAENIFDQDLAKKFGIHTPDQVVIMVHCGSRGFGHQIGTDYLRIFEPLMKKHGINIADRELACAPFQSKEGQDYYKAMACAANMAFANRQVILHRIREGFSKVFSTEAEKLDMHMVYDVAHNIAKLEEHDVDGQRKKLVVHRKGSTRAFPPNHPELADLYRETGQPVIIGGSMETGSYLLVGTQKAMDETFGSTAHGSGRTMSRTAAKRLVRGDKLQKDMEKRGIYVKAVSMPGLAEESGISYKNINDVIDAVAKAGISKPVVGLKPVGNVKG